MLQTKLYINSLIVITLIFGYVFSEELSDFGASLPSHYIFTYLISIGMMMPYVILQTSK